MSTIQHGDRLTELITQLSRLCNILESKSAPTTAASTQFERIRHALEPASEPLTAAQISELSGVPVNSARVVLYAHPSRFERVEIGPRRIKWKLSQINAVEAA